MDNMQDIKKEFEGKFKNKITKIIICPVCKNVNNTSCTGKCAGTGLVTVYDDSVWNFIEAQITKAKYDAFDEAAKIAESWNEATKVIAKEIRSLKEVKTNGH